MRKTFLVGVVLLFSGAGCCGTGVHTGWRFEVLRPPTLASEAIVQSSGSTLGILGSGCGGLRSEIAGMQSFGGLPPLPDSFQIEQERLSLFALLARIQQRLDVLEREVLPRMPPAKNPAPNQKNGERCY